VPLGKGISSTIFNINKSISQYALGGIINKPTMAIMGEAGPEAVIPLKPDKKTPSRQGEKILSSIINETNNVSKIMLHFPQLAGGGIVTQPTLAMIGEAGPEAIVPLGENMSSMTVNINNGLFMGNEIEAKEFARKIMSIMADEQRRLAFRRG